MSIHITQSTSSSDLECFIEILTSYPEELTAMQEHRGMLERELSELGGNRMLFLAREDSRPVAVVQLLMNHADNDPQLADGVTVAHVHHLRVVNGRRRQGIGRMLMRHIESEARRMGFRQLTLGVDSWNPEALAFYRSLGYQVMKEEPGLLPESVLYYMQRELVSGD